MAIDERGQKFSGAAKIWEDFAAEFPGLSEDEAIAQDASPPEEFRDGYVRLPYADVPQSQECRW